MARSKPTPARARKTPKSGRAKTPIRSQWSAGPTVLLVDDDPKVRSSIRGLLEKLGYRVVEAADADSALALIASDFVCRNWSGRGVIEATYVESRGVPPRDGAKLRFSMCTTRKGPGDSRSRQTRDPVSRRCRRAPVPEFARLKHLSGLRLLARLRTRSRHSSN